MTDLIAFLTAALDEDEAVARAAITGHSGAGEFWRESGNNVYGDDAWSNTPIAVGPYDGPVGAQAPHIARHDPARVLADVAAKRAIVERYACLWEHGESGDARWVLRLLAQPHADRPGFDEAWRA